MRQTSTGKRARTGALCAASALLGWREPSAAAAPLDYFDGGPDRAVGLAAGLVATPPFGAAGDLIDFVTVDDGGDVRTLAGLALASVIAPIVIAGGPGNRERATWLVRHGATAVRRATGRTHGFARACPVGK